VEMVSVSSLGVMTAFRHGIMKAQKEGFLRFVTWLCLSV
jgi:hypothetical protein